MDPEQAALAALKREVKLLRSENAYLREQLCQVNMRSGAAAAPSDAPGSQLGSRQPSRSGPPAGTPSAPGQLLPVGGAPGEPTPAAAGASRPASGAAGGGPSMEQVMRRLVDMQQMLVQVSHENERLAAENGRLRSGKALVANDYSGEGGGPEHRWMRAVASSCDP